MRLFFLLPEDQIHFAYNFSNVNMLLYNIIVSGKKECYSHFPRRSLRSGLYFSAFATCKIVTSSKSLPKVRLVQGRETSVRHRITEVIYVILVSVICISKGEIPKKFSVECLSIGVLYCSMPINNKKADNIALCKQA